MTSMNISLPECLRAFVEEQVAHGGYSTASEYVRQLLRDAQRRAAEQRLQALILDGLESGEAEELTPEVWAELKRRLRERRERRRPE